MLGRLLQAVEYYILIVTLTVSIFHRSEGGAAMVDADCGGERGDECL